MLTIAYVGLRFGGGEENERPFIFLPDTLNRRPPATQAMLTASVSINKILLHLRLVLT